jgi:hypothetical protein
VDYLFRSQKLRARLLCERYKNKLRHNLIGISNGMTRRSSSASRFSKPPLTFARNAVQERYPPWKWLGPHRRPKRASP